MSVRKFVRSYVRTSVRPYDRKSVRRYDRTSVHPYVRRPVFLDEGRALTVKWLQDYLTMRKFRARRGFSYLRHEFTIKGGSRRAEKSRKVLMMMKAAKLGWAGAGAGKEQG